MITENKLKVYFKYKGEIDLWVRVGSVKEKKILTDEDWFKINSLVQDLLLVHRKLTSAIFNKSLEEKLTNLCDKEETISLLKKNAIESIA